MWPPELTAPAVPPAPGRAPALPPAAAVPPEPVVLLPPVADPPVMPGLPPVLALGPPVPPLPDLPFPIGAPDEHPSPPANGAPATRTNDRMARYVMHPETVVDCRFLHCRAEIPGMTKGIRRGMAAGGRAC